MSRSVDTYGVFADSSVTPFRGPMMRADAMNTTPLRTPSTQPGSRDDGDVGSGETWPELYADTGRFKPARSLQFRNVDGILHRLHGIKTHLYPGLTSWCLSQFPDIPGRIAFMQLGTGKPEIYGSIGLQELI